MKLGLSHLLVLSALCAGCASQLRLTRLEAAAHRPSNVAVFFAVDKADGEPVANLLANDFNVYEDGKLVSVDESQQTIVNPEIAAAHYTLLLVDMSASVTANDQLNVVTSAASAFVARVGQYQRVAVYAFDGGKNLYEIMPFTPSGAQTAQALASLTTFPTRDPSTNLHGAILQALVELDRGLKASSAPLKFGSLVVFTDGTDRANRVPFQQMVDAVDATEHHVYALGVGHEIDDSALARIGKTGYIRVEDGADARTAFQDIADRIVDYTRRYYLLSYCSPARAGKHVVSIEAVADGARGRLDYGFDANGFGPTCDPGSPPPFDTSGRSRRLRERLAPHTEHAERLSAPAADSGNVSARARVSKAD